MKDFIGFRRISFFLAVIFMLVVASPASSQTAVDKLIITGVEINDTFPEATIQVKALDADGGLVPELVATQFSLREDGKSIPIRELNFDSLPLGKRVVFVIDELVIAPHVQVVRQSIQSFAENQMQEGDLVEVLASSNNGQTLVLVPLTGDPDEVVNALQEEQYNPKSASGTLLLNTVNQGLDELSALSENTEGLNTMVVFSVSMNNQLDLNKTIDKSNQLRVPIHTVLLGANDVGGALGKLAAGTQAAKGVIAPNSIDALFADIAAQSVQDQYVIRYRSRVDEAGEHNLVVTTGAVSSNEVTFSIDALEPPLVNITVPDPDTSITRAETAFGEDPQEVQPPDAAVLAEVNWPDGHPREIIEEETTLIVNGKVLGPPVTIRDNGKDPVILEFVWDLRQESTPGETPFSIIVQTEDELGLKGVSESLPVTLNYVVFAGDENCPLFVSKYAPALCSSFNLIVPIGSLLVLLIAGLAAIFLWRSLRVQSPVKQRVGVVTDDRKRASTTGSRMGTRLVQPAETSKAFLEVVEGQSGTGQSLFRLNSTTTLGRSNTHATVAFQADQGDQSPISRLHCTILEKGDFFELRDENSSNGTFLNDVQLRPGENHRLKTGDMIELARVRDGGLKLKFRFVAPSKPAEKQKEPEEQPKDGYTPTKLM